MQYSDMAAILSYGWRQRGGSSTGANDQDPFVFVIEVLRPSLRMDNLAVEFVHAFPFRRITFGMFIIALAHPEKVCAKMYCLTRVLADTFQGPALLVTGPAGSRNRMLIANLVTEFILINDLAQIALVWALML